MRKPKKLTALLLALTLVFACAACGSGNSTTDSGKTISGTLPEIIDRLYDTVDVDDEQRDFLKNSVGTVEIPKDQSAYYFGVENLDFEEAVGRVRLFKRYHRIQHIDYRHLRDTRRQRHSAIASFVRGRVQCDRRDIRKR